MNYGLAAMAQRQREKRESKKFYPKGFDIALADVILEFNLDEKQIQHIGELTATRQIAHATVAKNVYYRRATIERIFGDAKQAGNK